MTVVEISDSRTPMGRAKTNAEQLIIRFVEGVLGRVDAVRGDQNRSDFIREAVEREIKRREKAKLKESKP